MLKVGSPQPPEQEIEVEMEPTPPMPEQMPPQAEMENVPNPYKNDFDAGVDADEEDDPKRYIQQLTGKLSQKLRSYNDSLPNPDIDLNKYVAGMVNKQVSNGLSEEDFEEIIDKLKKDVDANAESQEQQNAPNGQGMPMNGQGMPQNMPQGAPMQQGMPNANESRCHSNMQQINELFQELTQPKDKEEPVTDEPAKENNFSRKPFLPPQFH